MWGVLFFLHIEAETNGRHFTDDIFKCIFLNQNVWIPIKISLKFVPKGPINNIPAMVQIMVWRRPGDKPLSEPMMVRSPTQLCVTLPQWVNCWFYNKDHHLNLIMLWLVVAFSMYTNYWTYSVNNLMIYLRFTIISFWDICNLKPL